MAGGLWALFALGGRTAQAHLPAASDGPLPSASIASADGTTTAVATAAAEATMAGVDVEVPGLVGKPVKVAEALIAAAGLTVQTRVSNPPAPGVQPDAVVSQWPAGRALVTPGAQVIVTYQPQSDGAGAAPYVVVVDAGHQEKPDLALEPIGPGSQQLKAKVGGGVTGVATGGTEYAEALAISLKMRDGLVAKGVQVVMVRTTNNVDIPNSKRAELGNAVKADLVVRVHMNGSTDSNVAGIDTVYPAGNAWVKAIAPMSLQAAQKVQAAVLAATGAASRGVLGRGDLAGFNYSTQPSVLIECGFLSNPAEDRLIATPAYQQKLSDGIVAGVMSYLQGK
jgi:N-acetylmuramoyl-L-alanine amidase